MKIQYSNAPCNKQKNNKATLKTIAVMFAVVCAMAAVKVIYAPAGTLEDAAAMANITGETDAVTEETKESEEETKDASGIKETTAVFASVTADSAPKRVNAVFPLDGTLTSAFADRESPINEGENEFHLGIDIAPTLDTSVFASSDGVIETVATGSSYGNYIKIRHNDSLETLYAHLSEVYVERGQKVSAGEVIARAGDTGDATGVHLHFEVRVNGECVDPLEYNK